MQARNDVTTVLHNYNSRNAAPLDSFLTRSKLETVRADANGLASVGCACVPLVRFDRCMGMTISVCRFFVWGLWEGRKGWEVGAKKWVRVTQRAMKTPPASRVEMSSPAGFSC